LSGEGRGDAPSLRESPGECAKPYVQDDRFGILNQFGGFWTFNTFATEAAARDHIVAFWMPFDFRPALNSFRVVPVKVTVSVSNRKDGSSQQTSTDHSQ
jgi:hypothetical protein